MSKILICILISILPMFSCACAVPLMGGEYDALINIKKTTNNTFKAVILKKAGSLNFGAQIIAGYYPKNNEYRVPEYWKDLLVEDDGTHYWVIFDLKKIDGYIPFIQVFWFPETGGLCGAYGKSADLVLE